MPDCTRFFLLTFFLSFSCLAMEQAPQAKLPSLKELAARQLALSYMAQPAQTSIEALPQECQLELARQILLQTKYQEVVPVGRGASPLYLLKAERVSEESFYKQYRLQKPTKHPNNPFAQGKEIKKGFRCTYDFTQTYSSSNLQYYVDCTKKKNFGMRAFAGEIPTRLLAGPNKNDMFVYADDGAVYICELALDGVERLEPIAVWKRIYHEDSEKREDYITSLETCPYENVFFGGTKSGKVYCYSHELVDSDYEIYRWVSSELLVGLKDPIDDMHLSPCGEFMWILSSHRLYSYNRITQKCNLCFEVTDLPSCALEGDERELMKVFTLSPDNKYALIGGTRGTIIIADLATNQSYLLEEESYSGIYQIWWTDQNVPHPVVAFKNDGMLIALKLAIAKAENYFVK